PPPLEPGPEDPTSGRDLRQLDKGAAGDGMEGDEEERRREKRRTAEQEVAEIHWRCGGGHVCRPHGTNGSDLEEL
ncbi:hypothetical protein PFISCL1PPCAC_24584, partial [Pristionchus fissidentatus]